MIWCGPLSICSLHPPPGPRDTLEFHSFDIDTFGKLIITLYPLFHRMNNTEKSAATTFSLLAVIQIAIVAFWKYRFPNVGALTSIHREMSGGSDRSDVYLFVCLDNKHVLAAAHQRHLVTVTLINIILNIYINTNNDIWLGAVFVLCAHSDDQLL